MPSIPRWLDESDVELSTTQEISQTLGTPGAVLVLKLVNNPGGSGADPLVGRIVALFRNAGDTEWKTAGTEWADRHYLEVQVTGPYESTAGISASGFQPLGANAEYVIPVPLGDDEGIEFEFRANAPADALDDAEEIALRVESRTSSPALPGVSSAMGDGIIIPLRDAGASLLVSSADVVENPGGADDEVQVQTSAWIGAGQPWAIHQQLVEALASTSSTERIVYVVLHEDGTVEAVDGPEEAPPAVTPPTIDATDLVLAELVVDDSGVIADSDITQRWEEFMGLYAARWSGLTAFIARGPEALVDGSVLSNLIESSAALTANETNWIWLLRDGSVAVTITAEAPADRSLLIHELDTDGSGVTAHRDRRSLVGFNRSALVFSFAGTIAAGDERTLLLPASRDAYILPLLPILASLGTQAVTPSSGQTGFEIEVKEPGGSFASILHATLDRPVIAHDATDLRSLSAVPAAFVIPGGSLVRVTIDEIPSGSASDPEDAAVILPVAL